MIFSSKESNRLGPRIDLLRSVLALARRFKAMRAVLDLNEETCPVPLPCLAPGQALEEARARREE